jgi:hypothetical protein
MTAVTSFPGSNASTRVLGGRRSWVTATAIVAILALPPWAVAAEARRPVLRAAAAAKPAAQKPIGTLPPLAKASWIWGEAEGEVCQLRRVFTLDDAPTAASVLITADNNYELYINGAAVGYDAGAGGEVWSSVERYDVTTRLARGRNVIGIRGTDLGGIRAVVAAVRVEVKDQPPLEFVTDDSWRAAAEAEPVDYSHPEYVEPPGWSQANVVGAMGMAPWGALSWSAEGPPRPGMFQTRVVFSEPGEDFRWPEAIAYVGDDCSVYVPLRGDAWGVCFRVDTWSRAYTEFDIPCPSKIGRKLYLLKIADPEATPQLLVDAGQGAIGSPAASYDGRSLYAAMALDGDSFFHIYRVPLDGGPPQRLTDGPFHDIDPAELPDGRIVFTSTRIGSFEEYHNPPSRALFVMQSDGSEIEPITFTPIFDNEPKVMADGRLAFIRTDNFFDRAKVETQIHAIRPDGTDGHTEVGADVGADYGVRLRALGYGSPAPLPDGKLACISSRGNFIASSGGREPSFQRLPNGLGDLAALPDGRLLATVLRPDSRQMHSDVIAVIDPRDGSVVPIFESAEGSVHSPIFVGSQPRPPVLADVVDRQRLGIWGNPAATGFLYCQNARFTRKIKADWQQIRAVRVLAAKALTTRSSHSHIVHAGHETVELGTVPIAPDGSFYVEVPADTPLALQAVDAEGRSELNEMSWIYVRPGERRSCVGCHAGRTATPPLDIGLSQAMRARPLKLLGQGETHRFRGNNSGVTGMMDLQFERFRETASLNLHSVSGDPQATGRQEIAALVALLNNKGEDLRLSDSSAGSIQPTAILSGSTDTPEAMKISAAGRLSLFRDRAAAPALAERLQDSSREVRAAAALALAACGTRDSVPPLLDALADRDAVVAQAAAVALENLTGHAEPFQPFVAADQRQTQADAWRAWFQAHAWETIEAALIQQMAAEDRVLSRRAIVALGHVGGDAGRAAIREFVAQRAGKEPLPALREPQPHGQFHLSGRFAAEPANVARGRAGVGPLGRHRRRAPVGRHPGQPHRPEDRQLVFGRGGDRSVGPDRHGGSGSGADRVVWPAAGVLGLRGLVQRPSGAVRLSRVPAARPDPGGARPPGLDAHRGHRAAPGSQRAHRPRSRAVPGQRRLRDADRPGDRPQRPGRRIDRNLPGVVGRPPGQGGGRPEAGRQHHLCRLGRHACPGQPSCADLVPVMPQRELRAAGPRGVRALPGHARGPDRSPVGQPHLDPAAALGAVLPGPRAGQLARSAFRGHAVGVAGARTERSPPRPSRSVAAQHSLPATGVHAVLARHRRLGAGPHRRAPARRTAC